MHKQPPPYVEIDRLQYIGYFDGHYIYRDDNQPNNCRYVCRCNGLWYRSNRIADLVTIPNPNDPYAGKRLYRIRYLVSTVQAVLTELPGEHYPDIESALINLKKALSNAARIARAEHNSVRPYRKP